MFLQTQFLSQEEKIIMVKDKIKNKNDIFFIRKMFNLQRYDFILIFLNIVKKINLKKNMNDFGKNVYFCNLYLVKIDCNMKKRFVILLGITVLSLFSKAQDIEIKDWWNDLSVYQVNKIPPRANVIPYSDEKGIDGLQYQDSEFYRCLNDEWQFCYRKSPQQKLEGFYNPDYDTRKWNPIVVPGNWETQGIGTPVYVNVANEFRSDPPHVPTDFNPVGHYIHSFDVPEEWNGRNVYINFGAVKSAFYLWINGIFVGYSEDSKTAAEFDITPYINIGGKNKLAMKVLRFSDGSYLEAQDFWRMSGITRDVVIYSKPKLNVFDFFVKAGLDDKYDKGTFEMTADINFDTEKMPRKFTVEVEITGEDKTGKKIQKTITKEVRKKELKPFKNSKIYTLKINKFSIPNIKPWSAETPNLYNLTIKIIDKKGNVVECVGTKIGFRTVEIKDGQLKVNGRAIMVKGVNRHEHCSETGQYVDRKTMQEDIRIMLENNINTVRTSHYPDDIYWYELCDKYGIYVIDEANNESHPQGYGENSLAKKEEWKDVFLYRCRNMLERDKNHPSIIVWSVGNECGNGVCTKACYDWMKQRDTRPVICERAIYDYNTDFIGLMYSSVDYLTKFAEEHLDSLNRPFIMVEYCHAMGNSCGGLQDYMEVFEKYPQLQGGCIWDFVDQTFLKYDKETNTTWYAAGGDLGSIPDCGNDDSFCVNGLITSDRKPHRHMAEVKKLYQNIKVVPLDAENGVYSVENHNLFRDLSDFYCVYSIFVNDKKVQSDTVDLQCLPGASQNIAISTPRPIVKDGKVGGKPNQEYFINFSFKQKKGNNLLPDNYEVAYEQFQLDIPAASPDKVKNAPKLEIKQNDKDAILLTNKDFSFKIDKKEGVPTSLIYKGEELLEGAIRPNFWRAPTLNDDVDANGRKKWHVAGLDNMVVGADKSFTVKRIDAGSVAVTVSLEFVDKNGDIVLKTNQIYMVDGYGNVVVTMNVQPTEKVTTFPKIGTQLLMPLQYRNVKYFGKDTENYPDRNASGRVGVYEKNAVEFFEMHEEPQESGNRTEVRWFAVTNNDGNGLFVSGKDNLNFSIYRYSDKDLTKAERINQIAPTDYWTVNIDYKQAPLGTATCGPGALDKYLIKNDIYEYTFRLRPFVKTETKPESLYCENAYDMVKVSPTPEIKAETEIFNKKMNVTITVNEGSKAKVYYTLDGSEPTQKSKLYTKPFAIDKTTTVKAKSFEDNAMPSFTTTKTFEKIMAKNTIFVTEPAKNYSKNKAIALMDNKIGVIGDWSDRWLGFWGDDMDATIELCEETDVDYVYVGFAIAPSQWVLCPSQILVSVSSDGVHYTKPVQGEMPMYNMNSVETRSAARVKIYSKNVRFIRVYVKNFGLLPKSHPNAGEKSWIMIDEVSIQNDSKK